MSASPPSLARRIGRLMAGEFSQLRGRVGPFVALAAPAAGAALACLGYRIVGPREDPFALFNGWGCAAKGAGVGLQIGAFVLLIVASQMASSEASSGTMRSTLLAPVLRRDVFLSKMIGALVWTFAVFAVVWGGSLLLGAVFYGFGDVVEVIEFGEERFTQSHMAASEMSPILVTVLLISLAPLFAAASLGLACSFLAIRPASALVASLAAYLPLEIFLKHFSDRLSPFLFVTYTDRFTSALGDFASGLSTAELPGGEIRLCLISSAAGAILFLSISFIYFGFRDISE